MEVKIVRTDKQKDRTFGIMYINDVKVCDTLEPPYMGTKQTDTEEEIKAKKDGNTAIPTGKYVIDMNTESTKFGGREWSKKYKGIVPWIRDVKAFFRVLIHVGNYASQYGKSDTQGCILVGKRFNDMLSCSSATYQKMMDVYFMKAKKAKETITLEIV